MHNLSKRTSQDSKVARQGVASVTYTYLSSSLRPPRTRLLLVPRQVVLPSKPLPAELALSLGFLVPLLLGVFGVCHPSMLVHVFLRSKTIASSAPRASAKVAIDGLRVVQIVLSRGAHVRTETPRYGMRAARSGQLT